ncbi:hypothetical protein AMAG_10894 [Allomyces macrogynus ATCC 38327]|uniref:Endoplasmic reticulum transmembrane protein n=1 Tax=Allomyces macrogynus (strain ATCC 38327) TaxID=578462 RepID=A0A0L0SSA8_ALLM3|nr:hypothetical protein AMAG_10894 [Allomyces macrogynus ATCC 38327]|eukprot:KNE65249.1 hypothetical protein AMAG_10894 [Allomyces macrogynus ATCC 38327]
MSLANQISFAVLAVEGVVVVLLSIPLPAKARKALARLLTESAIAKQASVPFWFLAIFLAVNFADATLRQYKLSQQHHGVEIDSHHHHHVGYPINDMDPRAKLFQAQRNMYLTGSALFLLFVINVLRGLLVDIVRAETKLAALVAQAANNNRQVKQLLDENDKLQKGKELLAASAPADNFDEKVEAAVAAKTEILKKQADSNHRQYMALSDKYNELEKKYDLLKTRRAEEEGHNVVQAASKKDD